MPDLPARRSPNEPVPTGPLLLALIKKQGDLMLAEEDHSTYLQLRERYLQLLEIAEHDAYCAPILILSVQYVLDQESLRFRRGGHGRDGLTREGRVSK